jgi:hypothetical protein
MKKFFLTAIICLVSCIAFSQKVFEFTPACEAAYKEIIKLKIDAGKQLIKQAREENPNNLIPELLDGYIDFFVLFFNEDRNEYNARKANFDKRLKAFDEGPENSPFYRYCKALTYFQRMAVRVKFGERYSAGWDFKRANSLLKENRSKFKSFQLNNLISGPAQVVIGTIPKAYKWVANLLGFKGSISEGMQLIRNLLNSNDPYAKIFSNEATFYYCYLMYYIENKPDEVFKYIQTKKLDLVQNHLFAYMAANLGINNKRNDYAKNIIQNRSQAPGYLSTSVWNFELGYLYLHKLELDNAITNLEIFVNDFKGNFYLKDALQKISWAYYLKGDMAGAERYRVLCVKNGNTETDADKKAYRDAKSKVWPNPVLLKARILNDGGYNKEALALLQDKNMNDFTKQEEALEFAYRLARIDDDLERDNEAIPLYQTAIRLGKNRPEYYAARAALQMGYIYEKRGQKSLAIAAFQQCIDMEDHEYKDSLDQKAKAGIARCKGE